MKTKPERVSTTIDLFSGIGGMSEGFAMAGCETLGAVEWDPDTAAYFALNNRKRHRDPFVLAKDVRHLGDGELLREFGIQPGEATYLLAGAPCQGFSTMGKRQADDKRNALIFEVPRFLRELQPQAFLIENVRGLTNLGGGQILTRLLDEIAQVGYENIAHVIVDSAWCGVPQRRLRVIVYGRRDSGPLPEFSEEELKGAGDPTVWDAIKDLPDPHAAIQRYERGEAVPYGPKKPSDYARSLRGSCARVTRWEPVSHCSSIINAYEQLAQGDTEPATKCHRLEADGKSTTLRAGSRSRTACRPVHPFSPRVITVREAARLHSFPDSYVFPPSTSAAHVAIGNAVPPLMAKSLALAFNAKMNDDNHSNQ